MRFKKGIIQLAVFLLLALSVIAIASVGVFAQQMAKGRPLTNISRPNSSNINTTNVRGPCYPIGDVDDNRKVNEEDANAIQKYDVGLQKIQQSLLSRGDVNNDGSVNIADTLLIRRYLAGLENTFPVCSVPTPTPSPSIDARGPCYPYGDVNNDKLVDKDDSDIILRYDVGLEKIPDQYTKRADIDGNGKIDVVDGQKILRYLAGLETTFPACRGKE